MVTSLRVFCVIITARKRSLRRLCFYTCLSFCPQGGLHSGGHAWWGVCVAGGMHGGGGVCMVGGMCGRGHVSWGACMAGGCAWWGACVARGVWQGGMHGRGHAWQGGMCGRGQARWGCVAGGCMAGGACVPRQILWDTVNEQVVRILLECILFRKWFLHFIINNLELTKNSYLSFALPPTAKIFLNFM